jgi:hypothetical protein
MSFSRELLTTPMLPPGSRTSSMTSGLTEEHELCCTSAS